MKTDRFLHGRSINAGGHGRPRELSLMMTIIFSDKPTDEWARDKLTLPTRHRARRTTRRILQHKIKESLLSFFLSLSLPHSLGAEQVTRPGGGAPPSRRSRRRLPPLLLQRSMDTEEYIAAIASLCPLLPFFWVGWGISIVTALGSGCRYWAPQQGSSSSCRTAAWDAATQKQKQKRQRCQVSPLCFAS
jgi:hypothetical protein